MSISGQEVRGTMNRRGLFRYWNLEFITTNLSLTGVRNFYHTAIVAFIVCLPQPLLQLHVGFIHMYLFEINGRSCHSL